MAADAGERLLVVDWERCAGHGVCVAALGERLDLDRWGYPRGVSSRGVAVPAELSGAARLAVRSCPAAALRLVRRATA
ncbi:MAG TPA: ferredoxin [Candidatus Nanopelagicales bacterium]